MTQAQLTTLQNRHPIDKPALNILTSSNYDYEEDDSNENEYVLSDGEESDSTASEESEHYYVSFIVNATDEEGDESTVSLIFDFETEFNYIGHKETFFNNFEMYITESLALNYPDLTFTGEFEVDEVYDSEYPEDYSLEIVEVI